jgi:hypothetical protein
MGAEEAVVDEDPKRSSAPPAAADGIEPAKESQPVGHDRRAVRTVDLAEVDIAAIETSEMEPGYEHLNVELAED